VRLSIVIPTLNEARYLTETVTQARTQAALGSPHEIIVADCGSTDGTMDLATRLLGSIPNGRMGDIVRPI
jgi:glycosyltransferase involved in cell wall biosynthesis